MHHRMMSLFCVFHICQSCDYIFIDPNSPEEDPLIKKLIVVMEEDGGVVYGGETQTWDAKLEGDSEIKF